MAVRASSTWVVAAGNLISLAEVVAAEENWDGEADDAEKCVRLEGEGRGEIVLEASPGKVSFNSSQSFQGEGRGEFELETVPEKVNCQIMSSCIKVPLPGDKLGRSDFIPPSVGIGGWTPVYCLSERREIRPWRRGQ